MQKHKTQQFAKFFLKDLKSKSPLYNNDKPEIDELNFSSSSK
tara:strand:+ start:227 stop:352 length:126 start_codon:yes stop_codon:yes gene_type:complete